MSNRPEKSERLRCYHGAVLDFALQALDECDLQSLLQRATEAISNGISVRRVKVLRHRSEDLLIIAGVGWKPGVVGQATLPLGMRSPPGRAALTKAPVKIDDLPNAREYDYSDVLRDHEIVSVINVPILTKAEVWGVLEVDSTDLEGFDSVDEEFLCGFARILGRSIENKTRVEETNAQRRDLAIEVREREVLFAELRHRIANQMHAAMGIVEVARRQIADQAAKKELDRVLARLAGIVTTNEHLSLAQLESEINLGVYLTRLVESFIRPDTVELVQTIGEAIVPLRVAVRLGLVLNELITNAVKHAFGSAGGTVTATLAISGRKGALAVADNGRGIQQARPGSSGTRLVAALSEQIGGTVAVATGTNGTTVTVTFPVTSPAPSRSA